MRKLLIATMAVASAALLAACDDEPQPTCEGVENACDDEGALECNDDATAILECRENDDGCLVWAESQLCDEGQQCDATGDEPVCTAACTDECDGEGDAECDGDVIRTCETGDDGCLDWVDALDCGDTDETCDDSGGEPECTAACTDECDAAGDTQCDDTVIQVCGESAAGCMIWSDGDDCAATDQVCDATSGDAECVTPCEDLCDTDGATQCNGTVIETCGAGASGCLEWQAGDDCAATDQVCDATSGDAECVTPCIDECSTAGDTACVGTSIATCTDVDGCLELVAGEDCALRDPPWVCSALSGDAECVDPATVGDGTCARPLVVTGDHFELSGLDFYADFSDNLAFSDVSCYDLTEGQPDVVIAADLVAGETIVVRELGDLDSVLSLQLACGDAEACVYSSDIGSDESGGFRHTALTDGTVHVVVEAYYATDTDTAYDIQVDIVPAEVCDNTTDDDLDGDVDCDDTDCFGVAGACDTELNCSDAADNDGDGAADCDDADCSAVPDCRTLQGIYEQFDADVLIDLEGYTLLFEPNASEPMGYSWAASGGVAAFSVTPGSGTVTNDIVLGDTDSELYTLSLLAGFEFYGSSYDRFYVGSNGNVTFGTGTTIAFPNVASFFSQPTIAGLYTDLDPDDAADTVIVDEFDDRVAITYDGVTRWLEPDLNVFQIVLYDGGTVEITYLTVAPPDDSYPTFVGISSGTGLLRYPPETNFVILPPETVCDDSLDSDLDGDVDCADSDCDGVGFCEATEVSCDDDFDNDGDGNVDCSDRDCFGVGTCPDAEGTCASPFVVTGRSFTTAGANFSADWIHSLVLDATTCTERPGAQADAIFQVNLAAGETVRFSEHGSLDSVLSILVGGCAETQPCNQSSDGAEATGLSYRAAADETVYLVAEAYWEGSTSAYDIRVSVLPPEACDNTIDDDLDGKIDCDDTDCFGVVGACDTELNCSDAADNDNDGAADCDDPDCDAAAPCGPSQGIYEFFDIAPDVFDLEGYVIIFTPDATAPMGYTFAAFDSAVDYLITPGTGMTTTALPLGDDDDVTYTLRTMGSFEFYGVRYTSFAVNSNGHLTFGGAFDVILDTVSELFAHPTIAVLGDDLDPRVAGSVVRVDEFEDVVAVTYHNVPFYGETVQNQVQIVLSADGSIELHYVAVPAAAFGSSDEVIVGIASGVGITAPPAETNFLTWPPETVCDDSLDTDFDGLTDCDDSDCFGVSPCDAAEANCGDGGDNDGDTYIDCADDDCAAAVECGPGSCGNPIVVETFPYTLSGTDFTADFVDRHVLAGTGCRTRSPGQRDVVFQVNMTAGQTLQFAETGALDAIVSLMVGGCGNAQACTYSEDSPETTSYTATADGPVYFVVEAYSATPYSLAYNITINVI